MKRKKKRQYAANSSLPLHGSSASARGDSTGGGPPSIPHSNLVINVWDVSVRLEVPGPGFGGVWGEVADRR